MSKKLIILFSLTCLFNIIKNQNCSTTTANSRYDCFEYSTSNTRCCLNQLNSRCVEVNITQSYSTNYDCGAKDAVYQEYDFSQYHPTPETVSDQINYIACGKIKPSKKKWLYQIFSNYK